MTISRRGRNRGSGLDADKLGNEPNVRFVESEDCILGNPVFIIADVQFWTDNEEELAQWLADNTERGYYTREGMVLTFASDEEAMWFKLRWC